MIDLHPTTASHCEALVAVCGQLGEGPVTLAEAHTLYFWQSEGQVPFGGFEEQELGAELLELEAKGSKSSCLDLRQRFG